MGRRHREGAGGQEIEKYLQTFPDTKHTDLDSSLNSQTRAPAQEGEQRPRPSDTGITGKRQSGRRAATHVHAHTVLWSRETPLHAMTCTGRGPGSPPPPSQPSFIRPPLRISRPQPATSQCPRSASDPGSALRGSRSEGREIVTALGDRGPRQSRTPAEMPPMQAGTLPGAPLPAPESARQGEAATCLPSPLFPAHSSHIQHLSRPQPGQQ